MIDRFGCVPPPDNVHRMKYPLEAGNIPVGPMVAACNWPAEFSRPNRRPDGTWWIDAKPPYPRLLGGHAFCLLPEGWDDIMGGWDWFDQGATSQCVAYASNRMQAINNSRRNYAPGPFYARCKELDGYPGEGTYVRTAMDILRNEGVWVQKSGKGVQGPRLAHGIVSNRWATSPDDILDALDANETGRICILNSWGTSYPHMVYVPIETIAAMMSANGSYFEATMVVDKPGPKSRTEGFDV